jgi:hypothetical protein
VKAITNARHSGRKDANAHPSVARSRRGIGSSSGIPGCLWGPFADGDAQRLGLGRRRRRRTSREVQRGAGSRLVELAVSSEGTNDAMTESLTYS